MLDEIQKIPYVKSDGKAKEALIIPVDFSLEKLTHEEIQVIGHLSRASDQITSVFAQQQYSRVLELFSALTNLEGTIANSDEKKALEQYNMIFAGCNSPWFSTDGKALRFPLSREQIPQNHEIKEFLELLIHGVQAPSGRNLYPVGITDQEIDSLEDSLRINSSIIRNKGSFEVVLNENRFREELKPVIEAISIAKKISTNQSLKKYLGTKIRELETGSLELRTASDLAWMKVQGSIDFLIGTAVESYIDRIKGIRAAAQGRVCVEDAQFQDFARTFLDMMPELEDKAPWKYKKEVQKENLPNLKFVDVITFSGDYDAFPASTLAESLPNEEAVTKKYGTVNLVFVNIQKAVNRSGTRKLMEEEFFLKSEMSTYSNYLPDLNVILTTAHEMGHASGGVLIDDPYACFGKNHSLLEEARAELFSMWVLPILVKKEIITPEEKVAGYYSMLLTMLGSMQQEPIDHSGSRNMMFNYLLEKEAIVEREEDRKTKYAINPVIMEESVSEMLKTIGNIRATGDKNAFDKFRSQYLSKARKEEFEKRLEKMPQGRLFLFPTMELQDGIYTGELRTSSFKEQPRTLYNFVK